MTDSDPFLEEIAQLAERIRTGYQPEYLSYYGDAPMHVRSARHARDMMGRARWDLLYRNELVLRSPTSHRIYWVQRKPIINLVTCYSTRESHQWCVTMFHQYYSVCLPYPDLWLAQIMAITSGNDRQMMKIAIKHSLSVSVTPAVYARVRNFEKELRQPPSRWASYGCNSDD